MARALFAIVRSRVAVFAAAVAAFALPGCTSRRCCLPSAEVAAPEVASVEPGQVFLDLMMVRVREDAVPAALSAPGAASKTPRVLSAAEADALIALWARTEGVQEVVAPKILSLDGQETSVFQGEEFAVRQAVAGEKPLTFDAARVDTGENWVGMSIRVKPTISADGKFVSLDLTSTLRELLPTAAAGSPGSSAESGAAPRTQGVTAAVNVVVPAAGGAAVFVSPMSLEGLPQRALVATLVRVRLLAPAPAGR